MCDTDISGSVRIIVSIGGEGKREREGRSERMRKREGFEGYL